MSAFRVPAQITCAPCAGTARYQTEQQLVTGSSAFQPIQSPKLQALGLFFWPRHVMDAADALTSREHHNDCENHFIVSDGGDVAKADGAEPGKDKVQGGAVAALWMERGHVT